jgi:cellulose synthase/poly-beta-1,6-N-acetylglucosamine synthase-like glycosyltransferase
MIDKRFSMTISNTKSFCTKVCFFVLAFLVMPAHAQDQKKTPLTEINPTASGTLKIAGISAANTDLTGSDSIFLSALTKKSQTTDWIDLKYTAKSRQSSVISDSAITLVLYLLWAVIILVLIYTARHYYFTLNRLFGAQRHPYIDIDTADWPTVTIFVAAHNEEAVIADALTALLEVDYPPERLQIMPVNDRSTDRTKEIIDELSRQNPGRITPFHRSEGKPGKAAALKDATETVASEILIVFDADYVPGRGLIKQLVAPFFDPENGAVMGRVVPINTGSNLLTRLLDMERSGGYQVDQQARMNLNLVPQYGGTVGGVRSSALAAIGGWRDDALAEDTDLTYRLLLNGWKTAYQNRSECYEEVPETWPVRVRQIKRWSKGHNQAAFRYVGKLLMSKKVSVREKFDGFLLLGVFAMSPILLFGWLLAIILFYFNATDWLIGILALFALMSYSALGNFAAFFEIGAAVYLDGSKQRIRLIPLNYFGFLVSLLSISTASFNQVFFDWWLKREMIWDKTARYRKSTPKVES